MYRSPSPLGMTAVDRDGRIAGRIYGTLPADGSTPEFAIIRLGGRFAGRRAVPLRCALRYDDTLQFPYRYWDMREAPSLDDTRFECDQILDARTYWGTHKAEAGYLTFEMLAAARDD